MQNRVNDSSMDTTIGLLENLILSHKQLGSSLNLNVVNVATSEEVRLYNAMNVFVTMMQGDVGNFGTFLAQFENQYNSELAILINEFTRQLQTISTTLTYAKLLNTTTTGTSVNISQSTRQQIIIFYNNYEMFQAGLAAVDRTQFSTVLTIDTIDQQVACSKLNESFWQDFQTIVQTSAGLFIAQETLVRVYKNATAMLACIGQYGTVLSELRTWIDSISLNSSLPIPKSYSGFLDTYNADEQRLTDLVRSYSNHSLSKLEMASNISDVLSSIMSDLLKITSITNTIQRDFVDSLTNFKDDITTTLTKLMTQLNLLAIYNTQNNDITTCARNLTIWTSPVPQIDSSQVKTV